MYDECRHILPSGYKRKAAALKGKVFCCHHTPARRPLSSHIAETGVLLLPSVEDAAGVTMGINAILRQYGKGNIDGTQAGIFFRGLQIAASLVRKAPVDLKPGDTVQEVCQDPLRGPIAPAKTGCDPSECKKCKDRFTCKDSHHKAGEADTHNLLARYAALEHELRKTKERVNYLRSKIDWNEPRQAKQPQTAKTP